MHANDLYGSSCSTKGFITFNNPVTDKGFMFHNLVHSVHVHVHVHEHDEVIIGLESSNLLFFFCNL